ncbi:hypothetical protein WK13_34770 [Burkholderia ubonensis]|uniref:pyruvate, phosphate dikinase n=1 Tax=Burkholderia ubonensis TaxID=101571 RepID=UPI00075AEA6F|nr:pyruvate, phosphate dikinase [Burkholderia ubonensis]KVR21704.1 hypothetical protein WK13_34770 [Burkholderia ubonensis]
MDLISVFSKGEYSPEILGGKGFGLWWMQQQGVNVPPAIILPTSGCTSYMNDPDATRAAIKKLVPEVRAFFEKTMGYMPLVSVRSGARVSMPGMMDTVLNVGIDNSTRAAWADELGEHCIFDSECRLIEMFGNVVKGIDRAEFEDCTTPDEYRSIYKYMTGTDFPDTDQQIAEAIEAVFASWNNERAITYRKMHNIPDDWGTAVVIQAMVFGNRDDQSATGVLFTRDCNSGEFGVVGEFLPNAQGEDVVAGIKTPYPLTQLKEWNPAVYAELMATVLKLEALKRDVQDVEFTIESGKLFILQTRNAKRSAKAAIKIALDMHDEGVLTLEETFQRITRTDYDRAKMDVIDPSFDKPAPYTGIPACSGVVSGKVVLSSADAINCKEPCILVTKETTPDDIGGMAAAKGILTMTGGSTSHAAVVARSMNRACVVGLTQDLSHFKAGQQITIDGSTGRVWMEAVPILPGSNDEALLRLRRHMFEHVGAVPILNEPTPTNAAYLRLADKLTWPSGKLASLVKAMYEASDMLYIDVMVKLEPAEVAFLQPFAAPKESDREAALIAMLEGLSLDHERIRVVTTQQTALPRLSSASTLEELVMASSVLMWEGEDSPAVQKVLKWKAKEDGLTLIATPGTLSEDGLSFVSESFVVGKLLAD